MKSYFSRLVARAQPVEVPVRSEARARAVADPFENVAIEPLAPPRAAPERATAAPRQTEPPAGASPATKETSRTVERPAPLEAPQREISLPARSEPHREAERRPDVTKPAEKREKTGAIERITPAVPEQLPATRGAESETAGRHPEGTDTTAGRIERVEQDQAALQRKADDFMSRLLQSRQREKDEPAAESTEAPAVLTPPQPRIEPREPPPSTRALERESERPSVVIGNVTVEIVRPAAPPPAPAREQVVVVRAPRGNGSGVPSPGRFGLGQF